MGKRKRPNSPDCSFFLPKRNQRLSYMLSFLVFISTQRMTVERLDNCIHLGRSTHSNKTIPSASSIMDHKSPDYILHPFTIPPNLTTLPEMTVKTPSTYTYVGPLISLPDLARTFHTWSTATLSKSLAPMLVPFLSYVHELLRKEGYEHYWLSIRATQGTHDSDVSSHLPVNKSISCRI